MIVYWMMKVNEKIRNNHNVYPQNTANNRKTLRIYHIPAHNGT